MGLSCSFKRFVKETLFKLISPVTFKPFKVPTLVSDELIMLLPNVLLTFCIVFEHLCTVSAFDPVVLGFHCAVFSITNSAILSKLHCALKPPVSL